MKLKLIALAAAFVLGLTASAYAASTLPPRTDPGCQVDCDPGDPTSPGDPFDPNPDPDPGPEDGNTPDPDCQIDCDPGPGGKLPDPDCQINCDPGKPGDKPKGGTAQASAGECGDKLGILRRVTVGQISGVGDDDNIDVVPVCRSKTLSSEQEDVAELRPAIGQNQVLDHELGRNGFNPEDVVGVIVDGRQVVLYVHPL